MTQATTAPDFGLDAWIRPFREAMAAFQGSAFPGAVPGAFPGGFQGAGTAWPWSGAGAWFGTPAASGFSGWAPAAGAFTGTMQQVSELAQAQWQQLMAQATGGQPGADALAQWRTLVAAVGARLASSAGPFELGPLPGVDASALREALSTPPVGPMREHVERGQRAMLAQLDYQDAAREFSAQLGETMRLAQTRLQERLAARAEKNEPVTSARALFDEWVEAGEQAWAERAGSDAFVAALGRFTNAEMKVRAAMADQVNRVAESLGLPTCKEVDADHRRIAQLERELRRLRRELDDLRAAGASATTRTVERAAASASARAPEVAATPAPAETLRRTAPARKAGRAAPKVATKAAPGKPSAPSKARQGKASTARLPQVSVPRALGTGKGNEAAQRRRAGK